MNRMLVAGALIVVAAVSGCRQERDPIRDQVTEAPVAPPADPIIENYETQNGTVVFAIWPNGDHEIWRVGSDGKVVSLAYQNRGGYLRKTE